MVRFLLLFVLLLAVAALLPACGGNGDEPEPKPDPYADAPWLKEPVPVEQPFLWRVDPPNGAKPGWLLGTMHVGVRHDEVMTPAVDELAANARLVMLELSPQEFQAAAPLLQQRARLPQGESLRKLVGEETWEQLTGLVPMAGRDLELLEPWFVALGVLLPKVLPPVAGGIDLTIGARATARGQQVDGLETAQVQVAALLDTPREYWVEALREMAADMHGGRVMMRRMIDDYRSGDAERLRRTMDEMSEEGADALLEDQLLKQRNRNWIPRLRRELDRGNVFVAVGCAHLVGEDSVLDLLRAAGYTIERVTTAGLAAPVPAGG